MTVSRSHFVETITLTTGEDVEIYRAPGGGVFGVDASFLAQIKDDVNDIVIEPINGEKTLLVDEKVQQ